jgi:prepilin-type N-terminal cleavage/methylation domain-containing protein
MKLNKMAFTLIELLVAVLIIGILAAIALPRYMVAVEKTKIVQYITLGKSLYDAQDMYNLQTGYYASNAEVLDVNLSGTGGLSECSSNDSQTVYTNGKYQVLVNNSGDVLVGSATSVCPFSARSGIAFYRKGGVGTDIICPDTKAYCIICTGNDNTADRACASLGSYLTTYGDRKRYILN